MDCGGVGKSVRIISVWLAPCDNSGEILVGRTKRKDGLDEQVDGNGGITGFHFGDAGLARFECLCEIDLRHAARLPDAARVIGRQGERILGHGIPRGKTKPRVQYRKSMDTPISMACGPSRP